MKILYGQNFIGTGWHFIIIINEKKKLEIKEEKEWLHEDQELMAVRGDPARM